MQLDGEGLDGGSDAGGDNYLGGVREIVGMHGPRLKLYWQG